MEKNFGRYSVKSSPLSGIYFVFDNKYNLWLYQPDVVCLFNGDRKNDGDLRSAYKYCRILNDTMCQN